MDVEDMLFGTICLLVVVFVVVVVYALVTGGPYGEPACLQQEGVWLADKSVCISREELQQIRGTR